MKALLVLAALQFCNLAYADLAEKISEELQQGAKPVVAAELRAALRARPVILITGIYSEVLLGYFSANVDSIKKELGQKALTVLRPSSQVSALQNAAELDLSFREFYHRNGGRPLLLIGHSKGGAESLLALLQDPALVQEGIVDRIILISGAVGGSHIADLVTQKGEFSPGMFSMRRDQSHETFARALAALTPEARELISSKTWFIRTAQETSKMAPILRVTGGWLGKKFGANDGLLEPQDELIDGFGTDLGVLDADHADLIGWGTYTNTTAAYKRAFTRAMLREVFLK